MLLIAAVGAMAFLALRSRAATAATGVPMGTAAQLRPDYSAQRNIAYASAGAGLVSSIIGAFRSGSPDAVISGAPVTGVFGGGLSNALEYNAQNGYIGQLGIDATDGWTPGQFGSMNGAYTFGSQVESPSLGNYLGWATGG
ncbi:hypothetical protein E6A55_25830 [Cupriavidus necator H16]|uniref:Uncharacterized protein n=1 Tax=Cupriavidus necator (strain ATCC 17699 / DSM 428 / KCTC 22496 / NCIMB 10442 / H16 / Stanier 337) TaxID=381666 RepID=Q0K1M2_CUPNH|nr:hypothetical protein [Cupriavidus necator]QCC03970.1 hypothetical protein E6A55_25830 [Cupriavidus necator H16]QQB81029.1 hypothetical protein I6H87_25410 [Cupriavidus necator]WKA42863.1 hypothetical protein QWP09_25875 [Cupriavidus necator]CAJ96102.1 Hypothetical protein H16_B1312 [Cupriavidus necator H16]